MNPAAGTSTRTCLAISRHHAEQRRGKGTGTATPAGKCWQIANKQLCGC